MKDQSSPKVLIELFILTAPHTHTPAKSSVKYYYLEGNPLSKPTCFLPFIDLVVTLPLIASLSSQIFKSGCEKLKFSTKNIVCLKSGNSGYYL